MRLEKVDPAFDTVPLPPGATAGMAVGVEIPAPDLAIIVTVRIGAELMLGRHLTWASPAVDDHRGRATGRLRGGLVSLLTGGTVGLSGEPRKRFGVAGGLAVWCGRLECSLIPCGAVVGPVWSKNSNPALPQSIRLRHCNLLACMLPTRSRILTAKCW
jgi:hypothetical protein